LKELKSALSGKDGKGILYSCSFGEDAAKITYDEVLNYQNELLCEVLANFRKQWREIH
jgi:hypothetical protein